MKLFLDASVLLTAAGSAKGASRALFHLAPMNSRERSPRTKLRTETRVSHPSANVQQALVEYEAQKHMPYITSIERLGREEGRREGLTAARQKAVVDALEIRFGAVPNAIRLTIETIHDEVRLRTLHQAAIQTVSIEDFAQAL